MGNVILEMTLPLRSGRRFSLLSGIAPLWASLLFALRGRSALGVASLPARESQFLGAIVFN